MSSWNTRNNCFWIIAENPYEILWGCRTCVDRVKTVVTNSWTACSDFSLLAMAGSEIPDRHAEPAAGQRICLRPNTEPILRNPTCWAQFKEPIWFTFCCLTRASLYPHITESKTMFSNDRNTEALRLQLFTCTISKFRNRAMAIRCKPSTKLAEKGA